MSPKRKLVSKGWLETWLGPGVEARAKRPMVELDSKLKATNHIRPATTLIHVEKKGKQRERQGYQRDKKDTCETGVAVLGVLCTCLVLGNVRERDEGIIKRKPERKKRKKIPPRARRREKALQIRSSASVAASDHTEEKILSMDRMAALGRKRESGGRRGGLTSGRYIQGTRNTRGAREDGGMPASTRYPEAQTIGAGTTAAQASANVPYRSRRRG
ncbi:hypothetical protein J3F84DRAFT_5934 [Trichoderma pleuroticola]